MDDDGLRHLLDERQDGVVSARQLRGLGAQKHEVRRLVRRRELVVVHPGVYVSHTGPLTWDQRGWAAVLAHWPAALTRESALPAPPSVDPGTVHVAIGHRRTVTAVPGVRAHRTVDLDDRVRWNASPPRVRLEHVVVDLASTPVADPAAAFRVLADACQTRETTPARILDVLADRARVPRRGLLIDLLTDLGSGACSVLEREWLRVERAHGLPTGARQERSTTGGRLSYRDETHADLGVLVELDGRAFHDTASARDRDAERDLDNVVEAGLTTVRLTYGQVFRRGCSTARRIGVLLQARGWTGVVDRCPDCPGA